MSLQTDTQCPRCNHEWHGGSECGRDVYVKPLVDVLKGGQCGCDVGQTEIRLACACRG